MELLLQLVHMENAGGSNAGHTSIFQYSNGSWSQLGDDIDGLNAGDYSGYSVSLSEDGTVVAIGEYGYDGYGTNSGIASIYGYSNGSWSQLGDSIVILFG